VFVWDLPDGEPIFPRKMSLLLGLGGLLLLTHALQLFVYLLGRLDSVGRVWLRQIGRVRSIRSTCGCGRHAGAARDRRGHKSCRLLCPIGSFRRFGPLIKGGGVWIGGSWSALTRGKDELCR
jgi:hypothetical protein